MVTLSILRLSVCPSTYIFTYSSIHSPIHPSPPSINPSSTYLSIHHSPIPPSSHSFAYLSIWVQHLIGQQSSANRNILEG